jgi:DNA-binding NtrC family response regulator
VDNQRFKILAIGYAAQPLSATKSLLEDAGYAVITALGIRTAFQTINSAPADLVLLDGSIPELSKLLLSQRIRQLAPQISVVVVSEGNSEREHFPRDCVLTHGCKADLVQCIDHVLAGRERSSMRSLP